jgi:hypothetical protein
VRFHRRRVTKAHPGVKQGARGMEAAKQGVERRALERSRTFQVADHRFAVLVGERVVAPRIKGVGERVVAPRIKGRMHAQPPFQG